MVDIIEGVEVRHQRVMSGGVELHVACAGEGLPVVLLHGFPENWRSWRRQFAALVHAGFSVWTPDLRGYNLSAKPPARSAYHLRHLLADLNAVIEATGHPRAHVGGHDWGGVIAWAAAGHLGSRLNKLVIFNAPHMAIYLKKVRRLPQLLRSWYVAFFLLPMLPERALAARDFRVVRDMFRNMPFRPETFSEQDIDQYVQALALPGALTAALNYYRANASKDAIELLRSVRVSVETLVIWGERDHALGLELLDGLERVAPRVTVLRIPDASHWVQNEAPAQVNRALTEFLAGSR